MVFQSDDQAKMHEGGEEEDTDVLYAAASNVVPLACSTPRGESPLLEAVGDVKTDSADSDGHKPTERLLHVSDEGSFYGICT